MNCPFKSFKSQTPRSFLDGSGHAVLWSICALFTVIQRILCYHFKHVIPPFQVLWKLLRKVVLRSVCNKCIATSFLCIAHSHFIYIQFYPVFFKTSRRLKRVARLPLTHIFTDTATSERKSGRRRKLLMWFIEFWIQWNGCVWQEEEQRFDAAGVRRSRGAVLKLHSITSSADLRPVQVKDSNSWWAEVGLRSSGLWWGREI